MAMSLPSRFCAGSALLLFAAGSLTAQQTFPNAHAGTLVVTEAALRSNGVYGFPQELAQVLADTGNLRFSVWNNGEFFYAQAIVWNDNDSSIGQTRNHAPIGDHSELWLDLSGNNQGNASTIRAYLLNPWPNLPGLHYIVSNGAQASPIQSDTGGRGAIRYVATPAGRRIRVDSFLIPLDEITPERSDAIRLVYYGNSPQPQITVNSAGFNPGHGYSGGDIPQADYQDYFLRDGGLISANYVPDGRYDPAPAIPRRH